MGASSLSKVLTPSSIPMAAPRLRSGEKRVGEPAFPAHDDAGAYGKGEKRRDARTTGRRHDRR
ncbi:hypothetical protein GCM10023193_25000 [Planotetraspora kaengkrachanensis]|uniref:Uncharacterized protein n=1 Tax=Planotetraspora kaengkrachanensis TaxID=575193 RepID=A0A8J3LUG6_9ACTN|nr:hypothetical protein Pka01_15990 [Planotetraspora kaengkrachanensis]